MEKILDRFLRYVAVDTQADPESTSQPSAAKELNLLKMLRDELQAMGVEASLIRANIRSSVLSSSPSFSLILPSSLSKALNSSTKVGYRDRNEVSKVL